MIWLSQISSIIVQLKDNKKKTQPDEKLNDKNKDINLYDNLPSDSKGDNNNEVFSEDKYKDIFDLSPDGIITVNKMGVVTSCNSAFLKLTGFSRDEIVGKNTVSLPTLIKKDLPYFGWGRQREEYRTSQDKHLLHLLEILKATFNVQDFTCPCRNVV